MNKKIGLILIVFSLILILTGILMISFKSEGGKENKEELYTNNIKLKFIEHSEKIENDKYSFYEELNMKNFSFRVLDHNDIKINFLANKETIEFYDNYYKKMYFNSTLKTSVGTFFLDSDDVLKYMQNKYDNDIYLNKSFSSGKAKIGNYDVDYFRIVNTRKEDVDIYEENFYIIISIEKGIKVEIKYSTVNNKFKEDTLEKLINKIEINQKDDFLNSKIEGDYYKGKLIYDKNNNPNKLEVDYSFKRLNFIEECYSNSSPYSLFFNNKEDNSSVKVFLTDEDINHKNNLELEKIKGNYENFEVEKKKYGADFNFIKIKYLDKESVIISKKINNQLSYFIILENFKEIDNNLIDNFLNIKTK